MAGNTLSSTLLEENPVLKAARANSTPVAQPVPTPSSGGVDTPAPVESTSPIQLNSSSISISKSVVGNNAEGITTDSVIADITAGIQEANRLTAEKQAALSAAETNTNAVAKAVTSEATNKAIIKRQEDTANLDAEIKVNAAWEARGGTEELTRLAKAKKAASEDMLNKQAIVSDMINDDSIGGFFNRLFFLNDANEEANVAEAGFNKIDGVQTKMAAFATATQRTMQAVRTLNTVATRDAHGKQIAAAATVLSNQYSAEANKLNAEKTQAGLLMNETEYKAEIQKWSMLAQRENMRISEKQRSLLANEAEKNRQVMETWIDMNLEGKKRKGVKTVRFSDPTNVEAILQERNVVEAQIKAGGQQQEKAMDFFGIGIGVNQPTLYESFNSISLDDDNSLIDGENKAKAVMQESWNKLISASKGSPDDNGQLTTKPFKLDSATASDMFNEINTLDYAAAAAVIEEDDEKNPNRAVPLSILLEAPDVADRLPVTDLLAPLLIGDTEDIPPTKVLQLVTAGIKTKANPEGTYGFNDALETMIAIYSQAAMYNTNSQERLLYNIPPQTTYNAKLTVKSALKDGKAITGKDVEAMLRALGGDSKVADLMDETILTGIMLRYLSAISAGEFGALSQEATGGIFRGEGIEGKPNATQELLNKINGQEGLK